MDICLSALGLSSGGILGGRSRDDGGSRTPGAMDLSLGALRGSRVCWLVESLSGIVNSILATFLGGSLIFIRPSKKMENLSGHVTPAKLLLSFVVVWARSKTLALTRSSRPSQKTFNGLIALSLDVSCASRNFLWSYNDRPRA